MSLDCGMDPSREAAAMAELSAMRSKPKVERKWDRKSGDARRKVLTDRERRAIKRLCDEQFHPEYVADTFGVCRALVYRIRGSADAPTETPKMCPRCMSSTYHATVQMCLKDAIGTKATAESKAEFWQEQHRQALAELAAERREVAKLRRRFASILEMAQKVAA